MPWLAKRTPGTPLSDAEVEQRRNAANSRWAAARSIAAGAVAAGAGAATAGFGMARYRQTAYAAAQDAVRPVREARARNSQRAERHAATEEVMTGKNLRGRRLISTSIRTLRSAKNRAERGLREHIAEHSEEFLHPEYNEVVQATDDLLGETGHRENVAHYENLVNDLKTNAKEPGKINVESSISIPKVNTYTRKRKGKGRVVWKKDTAQQLDALFNDRAEAVRSGELSAEQAAENAANETFGANSRAELEQMLTDYHGSGSGIGQHLRRYGYHFRVVQPKVEETVRNMPKITPAHTRRTEGYPDPKARRKLADDIRRMVQNRAADWREKEFAAAAERLSEAKRQAGYGAFRPLRVLNFLRNRKVKAAALAGGALIGGLGGWTIAHQVQKLAKADDDTAEIPQGAIDLHRHGTAAEKAMAGRLARVLGDVKNDSADNLLSPRAGSLMTTVQTGLEHALRPIDQASRGGISTPIPGTLMTDAGEAKTVTFTLNARSPQVEEYIQNYRKSRITALLADQQEAIKGILLDAARTGASPQQMALMVRQTIGLTPNQAAQVLNYKQELEQLDPGALGRQLRDARYDRTIQRAIDENTPLSADQVQKMTDAYHRKYLAYRAMTIARTEGVGAANNGHIAAVQDLLDQNPGYTVIKTWIATEDERTRPDHVGLHGQSVVGLYTPFTAPSGDTIKYPHDPDAPARQVVRCRCTCSCQLVPRNVAARLGAESISPDTEDVDA